MKARLNYGKVAAGVHDAMDALDRYLGARGPEDPVSAGISIRQKRFELQRVQRVRSDVCGVFWRPFSGR